MLGGRGTWGAGFPSENQLMMKSTLIEKRLYTLDEAATYLGRSTWSVRRLIWNGDLPQVRTGGRVHVDVRDMDMFIEKFKEREYV